MTYVAGEERDEIFTIFTRNAETDVADMPAGKAASTTDMRSDSLFAFIAGAAAGAALGILFAPEKGEVTRRKIKDAAREGYDTAREKAEEAYAYAKDKASRLKKEVDDLKYILKEEGSEMKEEARAKMLDQLDRLERALAKDEDYDDQFENA